MLRAQSCDDQAGLEPASTEGCAESARRASSEAYGSDDKRRGSFERRGGRSEQCRAHGEEAARSAGSPCRQDAGTRLEAATATSCADCSSASSSRSGTATGRWDWSRLGGAAARQLGRERSRRATGGQRPPARTAPGSTASAADSSCDSRSYAFDRSQRRPTRCSCGRSGWASRRRCGAFAQPGSGYGESRRSSDRRYPWSDSVCWTSDGRWSDFGCDRGRDLPERSQRQASRRGGVSDFKSDARLCGATR